MGSRTAGKEEYRSPRSLSSRSFSRAFAHALRSWELTPPPRFLSQCEKYFSILVEWNRVFRLTGYRDAREIVLKLFLDSLAPSPYIEEFSRVLDVGSGAGFPGLVLKLFRPDLEVTLVEATRKKVSFLKQTILEIGVKGVSAVWCRLGEKPVQGVDRGSFDVVTAKALGSLEWIFKLGGPYLKRSGRIIAMKGPTGEDADIRDPNLQLRSIPYELPERAGCRTLVVIDSPGSHTSAE